MSRPTIFPREVALARAAEQQRRYQKARRRALQELAFNHHTEYMRHLDAFNKWVADESGPLPGDEVTS